MKEISTKSAGPLYSCGACAKWVSVSVAVIVNENGYSKHFCGTECYEAWRAKQKESHESAT